MGERARTHDQNNLLLLTHLDTMLCQCTHSTDKVLCVCGRPGSHRSQQHAAVVAQGRGLCEEWHSGSATVSHGHGRGCQAPQRHQDLALLVEAASSSQGARSANTAQLSTVTSLETRLFVCVLPAGRFCRMSPSGTQRIVVTIHTCSECCISVCEV